MSHPKPERCTNAPPGSGLLAGLTPEEDGSSGRDRPGSGPRAQERSVAIAQAG